MPVVPTYINKNIYYGSGVIKYLSNALRRSIMITSHCPGFVMGHANLSGIISHEIFKKKSRSHEVICFMPA